MVVYRPSSLGQGKTVMTDLKNLRAGERYKVIRVEKEAYLVLEGFDSSPTGGVHWTEFDA